MNYTGVYAINKYIFLWHEDVILTIYVHYCIHVHDNDRDVNNIIIIIFSVVFSSSYYLYFDGWMHALACTQQVEKGGFNLPA